MMTLYRLIDLAFWLLNLAFILRVLFSWVNPDPDNVLVRVVHRITEPMLAPIRRFMPTVAGLDITPLVAMVIVELVRGLVLSVLF